jgi:hypothetical protein
VKKIVLAAALLAASPAFAQIPPNATITLPAHPTPTEHPDPLASLQAITAQTFDARYKDMVKAGVDFGAQPNHTCGNSIDGVAYCGNTIRFNRDGRSAEAFDFTWQKTGKHSQSICLFLKPFQPDKVCLRSDGQMWLSQDNVITKLYRHSW